MSALRPVRNPERRWRDHHIDTYRWPTDEPGSDWEFTGRHPVSLCARAYLYGEGHANQAGLTTAPHRDGECHLHDPRRDGDDEDAEMQSRDAPTSEAAKRRTT